MSNGNPDIERHCVEIRSYELQPGSREAFHALMRDRAIPMLRSWNTDVVAFGPSPHDNDSYYLIRAYRDVDERQASQDAFYGSDERRHGPREAILAPIHHYTSVVLMLDDDGINALRRAHGA